MNNKPKFDFGDLAPEASKSDFELLIESSMQDYKNAKNQPALSIRRPENFRPTTEEEEEIVKNIHKIEKGQECEDDVKYALTYLPRDRFRVLHNVFIYGKNHLGEDEAQEHDVIVIANNIIFDIEAKSIAGDLLTIAPDGQWEIKNGRKKYSIPNPVAQIERHRQNLLSKLKNKDVKIIEIVATNNERILIRDMNKELSYTLLKTDTLVDFIVKTAQNETFLSAGAALTAQALMDGRRPRKY